MFPKKIEMEKEMNEDLPSPWYRLSDERQRLLLEEELRKEITQEHPLEGLSLTVIARRDDRDDVLVTLDGSENGRIAEVHLTWSRRKEMDSRWPRTIIYESLGVWRSRAEDDGV
jgi:hypothetical protein